MSGDPLDEIRQLTARMNERTNPSPDDVLRNATVVHLKPASPTRQEREAFLPLDLALLADGCAPAPRLQLDLFGSWGNWVATAAKAANAPADYVAGSLLSATAACIGNTRRALAGPDWREPCVLWFGLIGDPSCGKSPAMEAVLRAVRRIETEEAESFKPQLQDYEARVARVQVDLEIWKAEAQRSRKNGNDLPPKPGLEAPPVPPRIICQDSTVEALGQILQGNPRGLLMVRDELAGWMAGMTRYDRSGASRAFFIEAYGARSFTIDRKSSPPLHIPHLAVSVVGGMQPDRFLSQIAKTDDDGLAARFLWVWPQPVAFEQPEHAPDLHRLQDALKRLRALPMAGLEPVELPLQRDAAAILYEFAGKQQNSIAHASGLLKSWRGKARGTVVRLALTLEHLFWAWDGQGQPPTHVSPKAVANAAALYENYFDPMAARVFIDTERPLEQRHAGAIARYLRDERLSEFTIRNLYKDWRVGGLRESKPTKAAVEVLVQAGFARKARVRSGGARGKGQDRYEVNESVWDSNS